MCPENITDFLKVGCLIIAVSCHFSLGTLFNIILLNYYSIKCSALGTSKYNT